jgi:hypothetical protein
MPAGVLALVGVRRSCAGGPTAGETSNVALAPLSPSAETLMVALPALVTFKLATAWPLSALIGEAGVNVPDTPVTEKLMALLAAATVTPLASCTAAV